MTVLPVHGFDRIAQQYRALWSGTKAGELQRGRVWRLTSDLLPPGGRVLDLGCGIGDDALMLAERGVHVLGVDASAEMVRVAQNRGVEARLCAIEDIAELSGSYDVVWSNFGAFNCIERLADLRDPLAGLVKPGGLFIICIMSRFCLWETLWFAIHGRPRKAMRRWGGEASSSVATRVFYPTVQAVCRAFAPDFRLVARHGVGIAVPPSGVTGISALAMDRLDAIDNRIASLPFFRSIGDHTLLIFRKGGHL